MQYARFLTDTEVARIHDASLEILADTGLLVRNAQARDIYAAHGCSVEQDTGLVTFPAAVIEGFRIFFGEPFVFRGRDPAFDRTVPDDGPVMITASSAPDILCPSTNTIRRATSVDIANIAFLVNKLEGIDIFSTSTLADDAPSGQLSLARCYPALKNCLKPVRTNTPDMTELRQVLELGSIIAGGETAYRERPLITHHCCPVISPLTLDDESTEQYLFLVEQKFPVYITIVPSAGTSSPMTFAGTLAQGNAEFLAANVLGQMLQPGTPVIYSVLPTVTDMRSGAYASGGIECGMLHVAFSQMARYYGVPSGGYVGQTNSHMTDAQSGYETGMSTIAAILGGASLFSMGGLLGGLLTFDYAKLVMDNEIALMSKHAAAGMAFGKEELALDTIDQIGAGGVFIDSPHTVENMRKTAFLPGLASRMPREQWESEPGNSDIRTRALRAADAILTEANASSLDPKTIAAVRDRFPGMVDGTVSWKTCCPHP